MPSLPREACPFCGASVPVCVGNYLRKHEHAGKTCRGTGYYLGSGWKPDPGRSRPARQGESDGEL